MTTQVTTRQIADGAVDNSKIKAGAAIATNKLADGAEFLKRDGSVAMIGSLAMGGQRVTNVGTPTDNGDVVPKSYVDAAMASLYQMFDAKPSARTATTTNINLVNPGTSTFDDVVLSPGEPLFVRGQSNPAENGLYTFHGPASALIRHDSMDAWSKIPGALFAVEEGSTYADRIFLCTANRNGTLGTTAVTFLTVNTVAGLQAANFVDREVPTGAVDGANTTFLLANTPVTGTEHVYLNGLLQEAGVGNDYTLTSTTLTLAVAPLSGEKLRVSYRK